MADYPMQSTWQEVDAAAQAFKNGVTVQTTVQAKKTSAMTAPVGVDANGKLWTTPGGSNPNGEYNPDDTTPENGTNAVIWYTNAAPNTRRFVPDHLIGPVDAVPAPGHMVISAYTGLGYFVTEVTADYVTVSSHTVQVKGNTGADGQPGQNGKDGEDGTNAVIWYTNGGPSGNLFPVQTLAGPEGATPAPGQMIISKYTGLAYFITEIDGDAAVFGDYTVQVKPNTSEIVSAVIAALPVYGGETQ